MRRRDLVGRQSTAAGGSPRPDSFTAAPRRSRRRPAAPAPAARAAATSHKFQRVQQATWSSPVTSRFLLEAGFGTYLARYGSNEVPGNPTRDMVRIVEQCTAGCAVNGNIAGLIYRSHDWEYNWNGAHRGVRRASYVTGAHSMKFGYEGAFLAYEPMAFTNNLALSVPGEQRRSRISSRSR